MYSIVLIGGNKIDITEEELPKVQVAINSKLPCIIIGKRSFAYHQFSMILPKEEADFHEKMQLRQKGYFRCRKYGVIHKLGDKCACATTGEVSPLIENQKLLEG